MSIHYALSGRTSDLLVDDSGVHIKLKGLRRGEKTIPFSQVVAVSIKKPSFASGGYIFFQTIGSRGSSRFNSVVDIATDENAIFFGGKENFTLAAEIKQSIEQILSSAPVGSGSASDYTEELKSLKALADEGVITQEEFEEKKHKLLGI